MNPGTSRVSFSLDGSAPGVRPRAFKAASLYCPLNPSTALYLRPPVTICRVVGHTPTPHEIKRRAVSKGETAAGMPADCLRTNAALACGGPGTAG